MNSPKISTNTWNFWPNVRANWRRINNKQILQFATHCKYFSGKICEAFTQAHTGAHTHKRPYTLTHAHGECFVWAVPRLPAMVCCHALRMSFLIKLSARLSPPVSVHYVRTATPIAPQSPTALSTLVPYIRHCRMHCMRRVMCIYDNQKLSTRRQISN